MKKIAILVLLLAVTPVRAVVEQGLDPVAIGQRMNSIKAQEKDAKLAQRQAAQEAAAERQRKIGELYPKQMRAFHNSDQSDATLDALYRETQATKLKTPDELVAQENRALWMRVIIPAVIFLLLLGYFLYQRKKK